MTHGVSWPCDSPDWLNAQLAVTSAAVRGSRLFNTCLVQATLGFSNVLALRSTGGGGSPPVWRRLEWPINFRPRLAPGFLPNATLV
jgi:hypothetical protein